MNFRIMGTGSSLPVKKVTNDDISKFVDTSDEWIKERTGIESRFISTGETVVSLAADAALKCMEDAGKNPEEIDLVLLATCSPEMNIPCAACQVQSIIGAKSAVAFDVNAACSGFLFALNTAYAYMAAGLYKNAIVIGAEVLSKIMDWTDRGTCILFGDGAGAAYVEAVGTTDSGKNTYEFVQHANGDKGMVLKCATRDIVNPLHSEEFNPKHVWMDGREIFKFAVGQIPVCINEVLDKAGLGVEDVDLFVLHQANLRIINSIAKKFNLDMDKFPTNVSRVGNMSSASIPVLLDECNKSGLLKRGMTIVLSGFGAGLTYGAAVMQW